MKKGKRIRILPVALVAIGLVAVTAIVLWQRYVAVRYDGADERWVYVDSTMTVGQMADMLPKELGRAGNGAAAMWRWTGRDVAQAHGAYRIKPGMTALEIYRMMSRGRQTPVKLTFNNIRTMPQLAARISDRLETDSASFMAACDSLLPGRGFDRDSYIAAFVPDSYEFYWTVSPGKVVETLAGYRDRYWSDERRAQASSLGLTPVQVATIASIAEEETNDRAERGVVARLYLNRLNKGMKLQADPTVKFAVGDFSLRRITGRHLAADSRYNTYLYEGLPPGPIRMPEPATMTALLESKPHGYLYMCAKEDFSGRHNFAVDYATHKANAARYHKALNRRNIK